MSKLLASIKEAIEKCELRDGMTISFHHHMRNGDYVLNMVLDEIAKMGIKDLTVNASSVFDVHEPIIGHIKNGVVTGIECNYMGGKVGKAISEGIMDKPVIFRSHGGRASDMEKGTSVIDVAFIAAPTADDMGNCTGKVGKSACGSIGLRRNRSTPSAAHSAPICGLANAENTITAGCGPSCSCRRLSTLMPSITGSISSMISTSGRSSLTAESAFSPFSAMPTSSKSSALSSTADMRAQNSVSSSASKILIFSFIYHNQLSDKFHLFFLAIDYHILP